MKVLFAHDHKFRKYNNLYYSTGGLSSQMLKRYTKVFDKLTVISRQVEIKNFEDNLTMASIENVEFIKVPDFKGIRTYIKKYDAKKIIRKEVDNSDAVIVRLPSSIGNITVAEAKKAQKPYVIEVVACPWDGYWNYGLIGKIIAPIEYYKMKKIIKNATDCIYVTNEFLQKRYPTKGNSVSCSNVELTEFNSKILTKRLDKIKNIEDKIIIGTTAAIDVKYKGQQYIIEALGELKKKGIENYEYHLIGAGDKSYLESIAKKNNVIEQVKFLGSKSHQEVFDWLETIDIYAQPSRQEGLPRALIEAMSRGVPAFGARTAGIPELLEEEYIFSNTNKNRKEIQNILLLFNEERLTEQAKRNYEESKKYDKNIIENRRTKFLNKFKNNFK